MPYAIIRVRNLHRADLLSTQIHNQREHEERGIAEPDNVKKEKSDRNFYYCKDEKKGFEGSIDELFKAKGIKERTNSVVAIEYVMAISNENDYWNNSHYSDKGYLSKSIDFIENIHGKDNIISYSTHFDESNPHIHVLVTPILEKEVAWKNSRGSGSKKQFSLSARDFTGGPEKLRKLQDNYHEFASKILTTKNSEILRGRKVDKNIKEYTARTNAQIGQIRTEIGNIGTSMVEAEKALKRGVLTIQDFGQKLKENQDQLIKLQEEKKRIEEVEIPKLQKLQSISEIQANRNKGNKWKKGFDFER